MTVRALVCLTAFNVFLAVLGTAVLFAMRPATSRRDLVRLSGVSYLLGVSVLMVALTLLLVLGVPVTFLSIVLTGVLIFAAAGAIGRVRQGPLSSPDAGAVPRHFMSVWSAPVLALIVVCLEAVFRKGRLQGLLEFDSWDSWGPKAKALYHFGHLDPHFLDGLPGGSYPPGLPALLASGLHAIGSPDMVTLHLQYWFLGVGFIAALLGLLARRVTPLLLLPFVLLVFVMADIRSRSVDMYGDLPLGYPVAVAALLLALWLDNPRRWQLPAATVLLAGGVLTKREGVLLAACVVAAGLVASSDRVKRDWPRLGAVFLVAFAAWIPWQIWLRAKGLPGNGPEGGLNFITDWGRGWDSLHAVTKNLFEFDLRLVSTTIGVAAVGLCFLAKAWRTAVYLALLMTLSLLGCTVIIWSDPNLQVGDVNVVSRLVGTATLCVVAVVPLALQRAWEAGDPAPERHLREAPAWQTRVAWAMVLTAAIAYPSTLLAEGGARFPTASDCVTRPSDGGRAMVVFGHVASYPDALELEQRAKDSGRGDVQAAQDGCGRVRVFVPGVYSRAAAQDMVRRARGVGLPVTLEAVPSD